MGGASGLGLTVKEEGFRVLGLGLGFRACVILKGGAGLRVLGLVFGFRAIALRVWGGFR